MFLKCITTFTSKTCTMSIKLNYKLTRCFSQEKFTTGSSNVKTCINAYYNHFNRLPLPNDKVFATYVWIDGSGINLRSKDRILDKAPCNLNTLPTWAFDGSSCGLAKGDDSDTILIPAAIYKDPFRKNPHIIVLCETYLPDGTPTSTNFRAKCAKILSEINNLEPWFGIEQEYTIFDSDLWPLGWPKGRGFAVINPLYSYCGNGEHVAGRDIVECHARACIYSGINYTGTNAEVMKSSWEYQIGPTLGIKAADDLWLSRYLLNRIAEYFGSIISFYPKPMGESHPGIGCHHNFSTNKMREKDGFAIIQSFCKILCERHKEFIKNYGLGNGEENKKRLTGKFETAQYDSCLWGIADRSVSIKLKKSVIVEGKGFLEDRRPAGDCDPYRVSKMLAETCLQQNKLSC